VNIFLDSLTKFEGMMKFMPFLFVLTSFQLWGQAHVKWSVEFEESCSVINVNAKIEEGWHIYSQHQSEEEGPIPTMITIEIGDLLLDSASEPKPIESFDENYGGKVLYFENNVAFRIALPKSESGEVLVKVVYMTCNEEGCLPPKLKEFKLTI
jgi:thiol:disulfide interchange protein DsbD